MLKNGWLLGSTVWELPSTPSDRGGKQRYGSEKEAGGGGYADIVFSLFPWSYFYLDRCKNSNVKCRRECVSLVGCCFLFREIFETVTVNTRAVVWLIIIDCTWNSCKRCKRVFLHCDDNSVHAIQICHEQKTPDVGSIVVEKLLQIRAE